MLKLKKINLYDVLIKIILIYTMSTLVYKFSNKIQLNNILGILCIIDISAIAIKKCKIKDFCVLVFIICTNLSAIIMTHDFTITLDHILHFDSTILTLYIILNRSFRENIPIFLEKNNRLMKFVIYFSMIITAVTLFIPQCYANNTGEIVYAGLSNGSHTLASCLCLINVVIMCYLKKQKFKPSQLILLGISVFAIFKSGSRVYLLALLILLILFYKDKIKKCSLKPIILLAMSFVIVNLFLSSSMFTRFVSTTNNQYISENPIEAMTSGRVIWWKYDIEAFNEFNVINKLLGNGFDCVYNINESRYGMKIWAHNDFIQLLLSIGIFGLLIYIYIIIKCTITIKKESNVKYNSILWFIYVIGSASFNGFYTQQHYVFSAILLAYLMINNRKENSDEM